MQSNSRVTARERNARVPDPDSLTLNFVQSSPLVVPALMGVPPGPLALAARGPMYTLSPEPMTERPVLDAQGRPRSVWSSLLTLDRVSYSTLVRLAYACSASEARGVLVDSLLFEATQTARWDSLPAGGWAVWVDAVGLARVQVFP